MAVALFEIPGQDYFIPKSGFGFWGNWQDARKTRPQVILRRSHTFTSMVRSKIAENAVFRDGLSV